MQKIYWLTIEKNNSHEKKCTLLEKRGYQIVFFKNLDSLISELRINRVSILILGDEGSEFATLKALSYLSYMPEIQGCRIIFSVSKPTSSIMKIACCEGVRDILPLYMPTKEWIQRFLFSIGVKSNAIPAPKYLLKLREKINVYLPARIVWISENEIQIESKLCANQGDIIKLMGPFVQSIGLKSLDVRVVDFKKHHLKYRFSDSILCKWKSPDNKRDKVKETLSILKSVDTGKKTRVFLAIQSPALRNTLIRQLDDRFYEIHTALIKRSIIEEPKYFSPEIIFIDENLMEDDSIKKILSFQEKFENPSKIVFIGANSSEIKEKFKNPAKNIFWIKSLPTQLDSYLKSEVLKSNDESTVDLFSRYYIPSENEFSNAEFKLEGEIEGINPSLFEFSLNQIITNFGLLRVESGFLKKSTSYNPFIKVCAIKPFLLANHEGKRIVVEGLFCNYIPEQKELINSKILELIRGEFTPKEQPLKVVPVLESVPKSTFEYEDLDSELEKIEYIEPTVTRLPKRKKHSPNIAKKVNQSIKSKSLRYFLVFLAITLFGGFGIMKVTSLIGPNYEKSGKVFSENLEIFRDNSKKGK